MLYLIGGPPRCGKTTLSSALAARLGIPYFSIDHIASVIPPYIPAERQEESFPLRATRARVGNDNDRFFETFSAEEIVGIYRRQAATCWPGVKNFITYAIEDEHELALEGWQLLPGLLSELPAVKDSGRVQVRFLYKVDAAQILMGLKANKATHDWVQRHTKEEASFPRIARMISCFGEGIRAEATEAGFEGVNMDGDFERKISEVREALAGRRGMRGE